MPEGLTSDYPAAATPEETALVHALVAVINRHGIGMGYSDLFSCFLAVLRSTAFHNDVAAESVTALLREAAEKNARWWADETLAQTPPAGEA